MEFIIILNKEKYRKNNEGVSKYDASSSVARGGAIAPPPIDMSTKMQNEKNTTSLALLRLFYALEWTKQ